MPLSGVINAQGETGARLSGLHNQQQSPNGPTAVPASFDFSVATSYAVDLTLLQSQAVLDFVQTIFIDNSLNASPCQVVIAASAQTIECPPASQGWFPVLVPSPGRLLFNSVGGVVVKVELCNFPVAPAVWGIGASGGFTFISGALDTNDVNLRNALDAYLGTPYIGVIDEALKALIVAGGLNVNVISGGGGGGGGGDSVLYDGVKNTARYANSIDLIGTPPAGQRFYVTAFELGVSNNSCDGAGTSGAVSLQAGAVTFGTTQLWMPSAVPAVVPIGSQILAHSSGIAVKGDVNGRLYLNWNGPNSLVTGWWNITIWGHTGV